MMGTRIRIVQEKVNRSRVRTSQATHPLLPSSVG